MMDKENRETLQNLLEQLRGELRTINGQPLVPNAVKIAVGTTFQILEILIDEAKNGAR